MIAQQAGEKVEWADGSEFGGTWHQVLIIKWSKCRRIHNIYYNIKKVLYKMHEPKVCYVASSYL